jgi:putative PIN family toxin of toxin-antitoxin system
MERLVLDTNVLISGLLWDGNEAEIITKVEKGEIKLFISDQILEELEGVLKRKKFTKKLEGKEITVERAVAKIALIATLIEAEQEVDAIEDDPDDNKVLDCAVAARATLIVSGDGHLLKLGSFSGIDIISAGDFIKRLKGSSEPNRQ